MQNQESVYNHLNNLHTKSINNTNDLEIENDMLQYKSKTVNKQRMMQRMKKKKQRMMQTIYRIQMIIYANLS